MYDYFFKKEDIPATVELTAYTGIAAFNIGFGAKTACSSFQLSGQWKKELKGAAARRLEEQWQGVVLLIVDEISFIGTVSLRACTFDCSKVGAVTSVPTGETLTTLRLGTRR